jgi:hypothetical protein
VGITVDTSQLDQLSADLGNAPKTAGPNIYKAFTVSSARVKREWQQKLSGTPGVPFGPLTITYDIASTVTGPLGVILRSFGVQAASSFGNQIRSDIGAQDGRKQAPIVTVLEFGAPGNNLPPHGYGAQALQDEIDDFANGLLIAIGDPLAVTAEDKNAYAAAKDAYYLHGGPKPPSQASLEKGDAAI